MRREICQLHFTHDREESCGTRQAHWESLDLKLWKWAASLQLSSFSERTGGNMATSCHLWWTWSVILGSWLVLDTAYSRILVLPRSLLVQDPGFFGILLTPGLSVTLNCQSFWDVSHPTALQAFLTLAEESEKLLPATVALRRIRWGWKKKRKEDEYMWLWHCADFHFLSYFYSLSHPGGTCCPSLAPVNVTLD